MINVDAFDETFRDTGEEIRDRSLCTLKYTWFPQCHWFAAKMV